MKQAKRHMDLNVQGDLVTSNPLMFRNRIINGAMEIDQRNAGASVSTSSGTIGYSVDRFRFIFDATSKFTMQQNMGAIAPPPGFKNYLGVTSSSAYAAPATQAFIVEQQIEGYNIIDLDFGKSTAKTVTVSFWVRSSLTGTFAGDIQNAGTRSYVFTYNISAANTWEYKTITIPGDVSGSWNSANDVGLRVRWDLGSGSNFQGTVNSWSAGDKFTAAGAQSVVGTNGATFYLTGVQLEAGSSATPFERRPIGMELQLCQRYYEVGPTWNFIRTNSSTSFSAQIQFAVAKRSTAVSIAKSAGTYLVQSNASTWGSGSNSNVGTITVSQIYVSTEYSALVDYTSTGNVQTLQAGSQFMFCNGGPFWTASAEL